MTVLEFVLERRIARACHYLTASDKTCIEIAFAVGFQTVQSFNRTFRRLKFSTPREWRLRNVGQAAVQEIQFAPTTVSSPYVE
jgi:AraC-like DNA-binding protein